MDKSFWTCIQAHCDRSLFVATEYWFDCIYNFNLNRPVLLSAKHFDKEAASDDRQLTPMQWGLVPSWHKGDPMSLGYKMNNCRREGMMQKRSFSRPAEKGQRCVVLVDG